MKAYITIDFYLQLFALIVAFFSAYSYDSIFYAYFIVGGAQLLGTIIRFATDRNRTEERRAYERALIWLFGITLALVILGFVSPAIFFFVAFGWLFVTPFYAIGYLIVCAKEFSRIKQIDEQ